MFSKQRNAVSPLHICKAGAISQLGDTQGQDACRLEAQQDRVRDHESFKQAESFF